jgi:hypothetical protein
MSSTNMLPIQKIKQTKVTFFLRVLSCHPNYIDSAIINLRNQLTKFNMANNFKSKYVSFKINRQMFTVLKSPHVDKKAQENFVKMTHSRLLTIDFLFNGAFPEKQITEFVQVLNLVQKDKMVKSSLTYKIKFL